MKIYILIMLENLLYFLEYAQMTKFIFDLDGTVTKTETIPLISKHFGLSEQIDELTSETIKGNIPFVESFIKRVYILGKLPVNEISELLKDVELYEKVVGFISEHREDCIIATGNLKCWVNELVKRIRCKCFCSDGIIQDNKIIKLTNILKKEDIVQKYISEGEKVVYIGEGNNDAEAMRLADISIGSGLTHMPANSVLSIADYIVFSEEALCRQLNQLL